MNEAAGVKDMLREEEVDERVAEERRERAGRAFNREAL